MSTDRTRTILFVTWALLGLAAAIALIRARPVWILDSAVLGLLLGAVFAARRPLNLTPFVFLLFAGSVLFHCLGGVLGGFETTFFGTEYDSYVHSYNSFVMGVAAFGYMRKFKLGLVETTLAAALIALGLGLFNELVEYAGYRIGGTGDGLFLFGPGDVGAESAFDNLMTDFFHDAYGSAAGIAAGLAWLVSRRRKPARAAAGPA